MLKLAWQYKDKLNELYPSIVFKDKYKFYNGGVHWDYNFNIEENSWNALQFVSVDKDDSVIGYLGAGIDRGADMVSSISAINFKEMNFTFSKDFKHFLINLFEKYKFRKIEFYVIRGNPAERMYDKIVTKYGGRVTGVTTRTVKLHDGNYYDNKGYEIFRDDYLRSLSNDL